MALVNGRFPAVRAPAAEESGSMACLRVSMAHAHTPYTQITIWRADHHVPMANVKLSMANANDATWHVYVSMANVK